MKRIVPIACAAALCLSLFACSGGAASGSAASAQPSAAASSRQPASEDSPAGAGQQRAGDVADPGEHMVGVVLGGSGSETVQSPAKVVTADDGSMTATIVWSTPDYDVMVVGGEEVYPVPRTGNATFNVPVPALGEDIAVQAGASSPGGPGLEDYTIRFEPQG